MRILNHKVYLILEFFHMQNQTFFLFFFFIFGLQAQSLLLSELENINPTVEGNYRPRICLVDGEPIVLFKENSSDMKIFIQKKSMDNGLESNVLILKELIFR